jgi:hypothetical protein
MSDPDPVTTGIVLATALEVAKQSQDFIAAAAGHPNQSIGTILGDLVSRRRVNTEAVTSKSSLILLNIGQKVGEVPLNVLQPALEAASLQEDEVLRERWANLLANAADPRQQNQVPPLFPAMLRELGAREVKFLDMLYEHAHGRVKVMGIDQTVADIIFGIGDIQGLYERSRLSRTGNMTRRTVADGDDPEHVKEMTEFWIMLDVIRRHDILYGRPTDPPGINMPRSTRDLVKQLHFSDLGAAFVKACRPPTG